MSASPASLGLFQRQYLQLVEPEHLAWPDQQELRLPKTQAWIYDNMFNHDLMEYPPPDRYQLRVLKQLSARLEEAVEDPDEDVGYVLWNLF